MQGSSRGKEIHPVDKYVGEKLRAQRILLGLSQTKLAEVAGITFQQIQKYEKGKNRISASKLYEFSKLLDVPFGFFLEGFSENGASNHNFKLGMSDGEQAGFEEDLNTLKLDDLMRKPETAKLLRAYYKIKDKKMRKHILEMTKAAAKSEKK